MIDGRIFSVLDRIESNKLYLLFQVFVSVSLRDAHVDKNHPNMKLSPAPKESTTAPSSVSNQNLPVAAAAATMMATTSTVTKTPIKTTISVNLPSISQGNI